MTDVPSRNYPGPKETVYGARRARELRNDMKWERKLDEIGTQEEIGLTSR